MLATGEGIMGDYFFFLLLALPDFQVLLTAFIIFIIFTLRIIIKAKKCLPNYGAHQNFVEYPIIL